MRCLGIPDDRDGLFDTILLSKNQYQKRAYQCIKMMVSLFTLYVNVYSLLLLMCLKFTWECCIDSELFDVFEGL